MSFVEIEQILDSELPPSSRKWNAWWANDENGSHHHAQAWLAAGFKTSSVNLNTRTVIFSRLSGENEDTPNGSQESSPISEQSGGSNLPVLGLLTRTRHNLQRHGIHTVEVARNLSDGQLQNMKNFGPKLADDLRTRLKEFDQASFDGLRCDKRRIGLVGCVKEKSPTPQPATRKEPICVDSF